MTTKKVLMIAAGVVATVVLIAVLLGGAIVGFALYSIGQSEAATKAKEFLRSNEKLRSDIGQVRDFGYFATGVVKVNNADGDATVNLKVIGERRTVNASVDLVYRNGREWRVSGASYENAAGQTVQLIDKYGPEGADAPATMVSGDDDKQ